MSNLINYCKEQDIPYSIAKIEKNNLPYVPDIICSVYYRYIINDDVIESVRGKIFNLHPSLLPEYKGCSSLTWAMINNEKYVGFTYHYLTSEVDCGNILLQMKLEIEPFDLQNTLYKRVMFESLKYFKDVVRMVLEEDAGTFQDDNMGKYYKRGCPLKGEIDDAWDSEKIKRFIRSMVCPPLPYARYNGREVKTFNDFLELRGK